MSYSNNRSFVKISSFQSDNKTNVPFTQNLGESQNFQRSEKSLYLVITQTAVRELPVIFLTFANDQNGRFLEALRPEQREIHHQLAKYQNKGEGIYHSVGSTEPKLLLEDLAEFTGQIIIFHYSGHADAVGLQLESIEGDEIFLHGANLTSILADEVNANLKLVFLNACLTKGLMEAFQKISTPAIIATETTIPDEEAKLFSVAFYRSMVSGNTLETAFNQAKTVLKPSDQTSGIYRTRGFVREKQTEKFPWGLYVQNEKVLNWKITNKDPLEDLPAIPIKYYQKLPKEPFRNLLPFQKEHAGIFFGRGKEIQELYTRIKSIYPIILFYGQSGVGKSSILDAGLLPRLEEEYEILYVRRGEKGIVDTFQEILQAENPAQIREKWLEVEKKGKPLIMILDQLEEAYTKTNQERAAVELNGLFRILGECFDTSEVQPQGRIILSYRKEYHPEIEKYVQEFSLPYTEIFLERLQRQGIVEAIQGITQNEFTQQKYNLTITHSEEGELPGIIADDLLEDAESALAPVLQILLNRMWESAKNKTFSIGHYQDLKKQGLLLQDFFDRQMDFLSTRQPEAKESGLAFDVLNSYTTHLGTADSLDDKEIKEKYAHIEKSIDPLIQDLEDLYLISSREKSHRSLSHDTLAPIIQNVHRDSDKPGQRAFRILESKKLYSEDEKALLDELDLNTVELGEMGMRKWTKEEEKLIKTSRIERKKRRKRSLLIRNLAIAAVAIILLIGGVAIILGLDGIEKEKNGRSLVLVSDSRNKFAINPTLSLRLAEAAYAADSLSPDPKVSLNLHSAFYDPLIQETIFSLCKFQHRSDVSGAIFNREEDKVLSWSWDGSAALWDLKGNPLAKMKHKSWVCGATFNRDQDKILMWSQDGSVALWDLKGNPIAKMKHEDRVFWAIFNKDQDKILTWSEDGSAALWDLKGNPLAKMKHKRFVNRAIFNKEEDKILTWSDDGSAVLWDLKGNPIAKMRHEGLVSGATFNKDQDKILTWSEDGSAVLWDLKGIPIANMKHEGAVSEANFNIEEDKILTCSDDGSAVLWDLKGIPIANMKHEGSVSGATFNKDQDKILTWSEDGSAVLWNLKGNALTNMKHEERVSGATFNKDEDRVLTWSRDGSAVLWNLKGIPIANMKHENWVFGATFNKEEDRILTWSQDGSATLWNLKGNPIAKMKHEDAVSKAAFNKKQDKVLTRSEDGSVAIWDLKGIPIANIKHEKLISGAVFNKKEDKVLSWSWDGSAVLWDLKGNLITNMKHDNWVYGAIFNKKEDKVLTWSRDGSVALWDLKGNALVKIKHQKEVYGAIFNKGEDKVLTWSQDGSAALWDIKGNLITNMKHQGGVLGAIFNKGEDKVLTWSQDGSAALWDIKGNLITNMKHQGGVLGAIFNKGEDKVLTWSYDGSAVLWDLKGNPLTKMKHEDGVFGAIFNKEEDKILTWSKDGSVALWDLKGNPLTKMKHEDGVFGAIFNKEEDKILTWSADGSAALWDIKGIPLAKMKHKNWVLGAIFNKDQDKVLTWSDDGSTVLWDLMGNPLAKMKHKSSVMGAVFNKDQDKVLSWSSDGSAIIWDTPQVLFKYLRNAPIAPLTKEEKQRYGIPEVYRK